LGKRVGKRTGGILAKKKVEAEGRTAGAVQAMISETGTRGMRKKSRKTTLGR